MFQCTVIIVSVGGTMELQTSPMKIRDRSYTIAGLILQATTLFIAAMTVYLDALSMANWVFTRGFTYLASLSLLGIGLVAIMLAYRHHSSTLETNTLKIWGGFHVFGLLSFIIPLSSALISTISPHVIIAHLVPLLILLIPPVLIIAAAQKESRPVQEGVTTDIL